MKKCVKFVLLFITLILVFNILLIVGCSFPSKIIEKNVIESSEILLEEGNIFKFFENYNVVNNNYTDSLVINEAYSVDNKNLVESSMNVRKNYKEGVTLNNLQDNLGESVSLNNKKVYDPVGELSEFLKGNITTSVNYARYWHGYLPFIRTMLIFFNISEIRYILLGIFVILFIILIYLLIKKMGKRVAFCFTISLILLDYFFVSYSLESAPVFMVMMFSCIILLIRIDKMKHWYAFIFCVACVTNFVDYLTVPLITLAMPMYIYGLYLKKEKCQSDEFYYFKLIIKSCVIWAIGYGMTWFVKWLQYDIIFDLDLIKSAIAQVIYRSNGTGKYSTFDVIFKIIQMIAPKMIFINLFLVCILLVVIFAKDKLNGIKLKSLKLKFKENLYIIVVSFLPFVWYIALGNHTCVHTHFVYRHLLIFFTGMFLLLNNLIELPKLKKKDKKLKVD